MYPFHKTQNVILFSITTQTTRVIYNGTHTKCFVVAVILHDNVRFFCIFNYFLIHRALATAFMLCIANTLKRHLSRGNQSTTRKISEPSNPAKLSGNECSPNHIVFRIVVRIHACPSLGSVSWYKVEFKSRWLLDVSPSQVRFLGISKIVNFTMTKHTDKLYLINKTNHHTEQDASS